VKQVWGEYDEEYRVVRPDGSLRWVRDRAFPVRDQTGQVYRVVGIAEDITKQKKTEEQLRAATVLMSSLIDNLQRIISSAIERRNLVIEESETQVINLVLLIAKTADLAQLQKQLIGQVKWVLDFERCTLALLNDEGLIAFCESDFVVIPSGILLHYISGKPVFLTTRPTRTRTW
jgi:L-fucose isomerase-like protein